MLFSYTTILLSQTWLNNLQKKEKRTLTLLDYQKAFNKYWEPFNVKNGKYLNEKGKLVKAPGWKQFKRWEWYMESQVNPITGEFPGTNAFIEFEKTMKTNSSMKATSDNWVCLGPNSSTGGYAGVGRINCIAFHPSNNNIYWVGAPAGGLWVTTDNGSTWSCLTDNNNVLGVSDIIIPSDYETSNTIYIATGDRDGWDNRSVGVLKSMDGGNTWNSTDLAFTLQDGQMTTKLLLDPNDDNTIIAATTSGIYKTVDGGENFTLLSSNSFIDLEYKSGSFSTLYGCTTGGDIFYSINEGVDWIQALSISGGQRVELSVSPDEPSWVYAVIANSSDGLYGVYKSEDSGISYTQIFDGSISGSNLLGWSSDGTGTDGQGYYDLSIATSPVDANIVLIGGVNTWRSLNGGSTWSIVNHWSGDAVQAVHADKHNLKFRPNGDLFEVNDGGVYLSSLDGNSGSWIDKTNGMIISQMYRLSVSQINSDEIITGLQDNGSKLYSGNNWYDVKGGDGMECLIDYTNDDVQYATYVRGQIDRTLDHWMSRVNIQPDGTSGAWVSPYIIHPTESRTLFAGYSDVWKTTDRGNSWKKISDINTVDKIRSMAISTSNPEVIYVADRTHLWKTENGGESWIDITGTLPGNAITYIAVKGDDENTLWVTFGGYDSNRVYQSVDGGSTWNDISLGLPNIPVNTIVYNKLESTEINLYVGTEVGVYYKLGLAEWEFYDTGLPKVKVDELEMFYDLLVPSNSRLRAATYGRGLWETPLELSGNFAPFVKTSDVNNIDLTTATLNGEIVEDYGSSILESGFVYSATPNPRIDEPGVVKIETSPTVSSGTFNANITGLTHSTRYYFRAYAINSNGISYGSTSIFNTQCGSLVDFPWLEDFESGDVSLCWETVSSLDNEIKVTSDYNVTTNGEYSIRFSSENFSSDYNQYIITQAIVVDSDNAKFSFSHRKSSIADESLEWGISTSSNGITDFVWTEVDLYNWKWDEEVIDLSNYIGQTIYLAFHYYGDNIQYVYIDDVSISCSLPIILTQPENLTINEGNDATFAVVTSGSNLTYQWYKGGALISGATESSYMISNVSASDDAGYSCVVSNGCSQLETNIVTLSVINTSLNELQEKGIKIFPNPVQGALNVLFDEFNEGVSLTISDLSGKKILNKVIKQKESAIDLRGVSKGLYLLELKIKNEVIVTKIMVE